MHADPRRLCDGIRNTHPKRDTRTGLAQPCGAHHDGRAFRGQRLGHCAELTLAVSPVPVLLERDPAVDQPVRLDIDSLVVSSGVQEDDPTEIGESARCGSLVPDPLGLALCEFRAGVKDCVVSILRQVQTFRQDGIPAVKKGRFEGRCSVRCCANSVEIFQGLFHHERESRHFIHHRFIVGIEGHGAIGAFRVERRDSLRKERPPSRNRSGRPCRKRVRPRDAPLRTQGDLFQALSILKLQSCWGRADHPAAWGPSIFTWACIGDRY